MTTIYAQPKLQAVLDNTPKKRTFLTDLFFTKNTELVQDEEFAFDIVDGKRKLAPWVHPRVDGVLMEDAAYQTLKYSAQELAPYRTIDPQQMLKYRVAGEALSGSGVLSPAEREKREATRKLLLCQDEVWNRIEESVAQELFTGKLIMKGEGVDDEVSFWPTTDQPYKKLAGTAVWDNAASLILDDLDTAKQEISKHGLTADIAILGNKAYKALRNNKGVWEQLDTRNLNIGEIGVPTDLPQGARYVGVLEGLALYTYNETYYDEATDTDAYFVPQNKVLVASTATRTTLAFQIVSIIDPRKEDPMYFLNTITGYSEMVKGLGRKIMVKSRPLPVINQIRGFYVLEVLA